MTGQSFNSTLVQLKDWNMKMWRQKYRCFNSTLVQLKVRTMISGPLTCTGFNSTLVQLKVDLYTQKVKQLQFQFYLSSIKSETSCRKTPELNGFQFYLSSIKSQYLFIFCPSKT